MVLSESGYLTCVANDFGYDAVFQRGVEAFGCKEDVFIGLKSFGLSGPAKDVYEHFQITVDRVIKEVTKVLNI